MLQIVDNLPGAAATRGQLPPGGSIRDVAVYCWLPQEATRRWLAAHGYPWPAHFEPVGPAAGPAHSNTAQPNRSGTRTNRSAAAEKACAEWLSRLAERPASKDAAFEAAKAAVASVGALSRKAFERQWPITVPDDWKRGGRRKITTPEI